MLISHEWLQSFVPHNRSPEELQHLISAHVATVDRMERLRADLAPVVVARVVEAARHPNSDHLWVTKVDDGSGTLLDVVCGAPNVTVGTLYPFARVGTQLPGGLKLERRKIRGEVSNGMLCSARELRLGEDHEGIMALSVEANPGTPFLEVMPIGDVRYDVDVLPNRPDLLSHLGMAREVAALTRVAVREPPELSNVEANGAPVAVRGSREASSGGVTIRIEDPEGCPHYMGVVIRGVTVGPSPEWLVKRLESVGLRSINNVVDVTNFVLWGYGQPTHAFDLARLARSTIVVRRARAGESIVTLDGHERRLTPEMTLIADAERAVAVAGVMGGRDSEVTETTRDILLEVAYFDPRRVRITRRALGLSTDASYRFERGIDPAITARVVTVATALLAQLTSGRVDGSPIDVGIAPEGGRGVRLRPARVDRLLGQHVEPNEIARLLMSVGFAVRPGLNDTLEVQSPSWRNDVSTESDLVEEIARLRGYDALPNDVQPFRPSSIPDDPVHTLARRVRDELVAAGLVEVRPMPFVRGADETHVRVRNPLADDEPHLRLSVLETLAKRAEYNLSRMQGNIRIFEVGSAFAPRPGRLPDEEVRVGAVIMGDRRPPHFTEPRPPKLDLWDAKALAERVSGLVAADAQLVMSSAGADTLWKVERSGTTIGAVRRLALDAPPWASQAFGIEITLAAMPNAAVAPPGQHVHASDEKRVDRSPAVPYRSLPSTPAAEFDLALLLPAGMRAAEVENVMRTSAGDLLERLTLFDEYRGDELPGGYRSVAWTLTFRDPSRTLREKEIEGRRQKILKSLESELGVRPRTA
jgi:phenylalanyl-tRNA synthetase beta chain